MIVLMEHPAHGRMHVYDVAEKKKIEQWGWTEVVDKPEPEKEPEQKRKPGRPRKE